MMRSFTSLATTNKITTYLCPTILICWRRTKLNRSFTREWRILSINYRTSWIKNETTQWRRGRKILISCGSKMRWKDSCWRFKGFFNVNWIKRWVRYNYWMTTTPHWMVEIYPMLMNNSPICNNKFFYIQWNPNQSRNPSIDWINRWPIFFSKIG